VKTKAKNIKLNSIFSKVTGSIRTKLIFGFLVPVVFIVILGISAYISSSKAITQIFTDATIASIDKTGEYFGLILQNIEDKAVSLTFDVQIRDYYSGKYAGDILAEGNAYKAARSQVSTIATSDRYIENIFIIPNTGKPITSFGSFDDNFDPYSAFIETEEAKVINEHPNVNLWLGYHDFIDEHLDVTKDKYAITLVKPLYNSSSKQIGYIFMDVTMNVISEAMSTLNLPENSYIAFISQDGREITPDGIAKEAHFTGLKEYQDIHSSPEANNHLTIDYNNQDYELIYSKVGNSGAVVCAMIPSSYLRDQAGSIMKVTIFLVSLAVILAVAIGIFIAYGFDKAIKTMISTLSSASKGNLTAAIDKIRNDEFGVLSLSINEMIANLKAIIDKATKVGQTVVESARKVSENSEFLLTSSKNITLAISEIQQGNVQQAEDTQRCLKLSDDLANQINNVHDNTLAIEQIAETTRSIVKDGINVIEELTKAANESLRVTNETIRDISELERESKVITEIIAVINEIAAQTNLLSLNASIEAARAGEAGRGFAVVADEIRNLSGRSVAAAQEIEEIIKNIIVKTQTTVNTVKQAEVISQNTEARLNNVVKLFDNINLYVDDLANKLEKIAGSIGEINQSKVHTLNAIESISAVAEEISASSQEVDATAQEQLEAVTRLNEAVKALNQDASDLEKAIEMFITK